MFWFADLENESLGICFFFWLKTICRYREDADATLYKHTHAHSNASILTMCERRELLHTVALHVRRDAQRQGNDLRHYWGQLFCSMALSYSRGWSLGMLGQPGQAKATCASLHNSSSNSNNKKKHNIKNNSSSITK